MMPTAPVGGEAAPVASGSGEAGQVDHAAFRASVLQSLESNYATGSSALRLKQARHDREQRLLHSMEQDRDLDAEARARALEHHAKRESAHLRTLRAAPSLSDFEQLEIIGKGAFGEVRVCREVASGAVFAMKKLRKGEMVRRGHVGHVRGECDAMERCATGSNLVWFVQLQYAFADADWAYMIMDYVPGGDLMGLLMVREQLAEADARFYAAQMTAALDTLHALGIAHRDIKPDNVLIGVDGHIKVADFGLAKCRSTLKYHTASDADTPNRPPARAPAAAPSEAGPSAPSRRETAWSVVGTPDYMAPEVIMRQACGPQCDWWSMGAVLYEMLIGYAPFAAEDPLETARNVVHFRETLAFPPEVPLSAHAEDLMRRLLVDQEARLGRTDGAAEVKRHPFFDGIDWANLRAPNAPVPFKPTIASATDTSHFDKFEDTTSPQPSRTSKVMITPPRSADLDDLAFADFRYRRFSHDTFAGRADADGDAPGRLSATAGMADGAGPASSDA